MTWLHETIEAQRALLTARLESPMAELALRCAESWRACDLLDEILDDALTRMPVCQLLYATDTNGRQVSSNVGRHAIDRSKYGQNLARRPYLSSAVPYKGFLLSEVYLGANDRRSCITAVQAVAQGSSMLGFVADFYLRDLPQLDRRAASGQSAWRQIKGDPAIRDSLFQQQRARSAMDDQIDDVIVIMSELIGERGVFHAKLRFSSSRATLWLTDDPVGRQKDKNSQVREFMAEAQEFGLNSGVSFPIHSAQGEFAMLNLASSEDYTRTKSSITAAMPHVSMFSAHLHEAVRRVFQHQVLPLTRVHLTDREKQCLLWAAEGKTTWETSHIFGVSERTVIFHLQNAAEKLKVVRRQQAVARAISLGLISPQLG